LLGDGPDERIAIEHTEVLIICIRDYAPIRVRLLRLVSEIPPPVIADELRCMQDIATPLPHHVCESQTEDRSANLAVVRGEIDCRGKPITLENRRCSDGKVMHAIIEGDADAAFRKGVGVQPCDRLAERENVVARGFQQREALLECIDADVEAWIPFVLVVD